MTEQAHHDSDQAVSPVGAHPAQLTSGFSESRGGSSLSAHSPQPSRVPLSRDDYWRVTARAWWAACLSVFALALFEACKLALGAERGAGAPAWGGTLSHIVSLYTLCVTPYALVWALCSPSLILMLPKPRHWIGLGLSPSSRHAYLSGAVTLGVSLLILVGISAQATLISRGFNRGLLAAIWVSGLCVVGLLVAALLAPTWYRVTHALLSRIAPRGALGPLPLSVLPSALIICIGVAGVLWISSLPLGAYQLEGYLLLLGLPLLTVSLYGALSLYNAEPHTSVSPLGWASRALGAACLMIALGAWGVSGWEVTHPSNQLIPQQGSLSGLLLNTARALSDGDGDGVSAKLGGGDCDDTNPNVSPRAREIPDNGIDDNCEGGDAQTPKEVTPPSELKSAPEVAKRWNVIMILVDTLRASHLELHGYDRPTMPNLTRFAQESVYFERAFAHAPRTPFSIPSALIGRYPSRIKWVKRYSNYSVLKDENETIFERFKRAGWRTEAVSSHWYFGAKKGVNLGQGVDRWDNSGELSVSKSNTQSAAGGVTKRLLERMRALSAQSSDSSSDAQEPTLIFAHYFAPHGRYMNHRVRCKQSKKFCHREPRCIEHSTQCVFGDPKARSVKKLINKYDSELAYTDIHLGDVLRAYSELKLDQNTVVVIMSDHGESFKDRKPKYLFHGRSVYNEELHVPLIIRTPESVAQRRSEVVGLIDVSPTLSALTGVPRGETDGVSLMGLLKAPDQSDASTKLPKRTLFLEQLPYPGHKVHIVSGVTNTGLKLIRNITKQTWALYDLKHDMKERVNLWRDSKVLNSTEVKSLRSALSQFIEFTP